MQSISLAQLAAIVPVSVIAIDAIRRIIQGKLERKGLPLPPGPTQTPMLGNILSIDREKPWETYTEWHAIYGDVFYLRILDQDVVVLGSQPVAVELLEKRSKIYSDRPFIATLKPYGVDCIFAFAPYGDHWRLCRRIVHQTYHANAALSLRPMQLRKARQLVRTMVKNPDCYEHIYAVFSTAVSLAATYGYEVNTQDDPLVQYLEEFLEGAVPAATPERAVLLKCFPFLSRLPDWIPCCSWKSEARRTRDLSEKLTEIPYQYTKEHMTAHSKRPVISMVSHHISRMHDSNQSHHADSVFTLKKAAVSTTLASSETTISTLMVFTLAMVLNPRVWKRAQTEIDAVIGTDRLPDFGDRPALPYIDAIIRETLRWQPAVPLGVWHATSDSDIYNGQYIPKGATVVANAWAMSRDGTRFSNAKEFIPERFLNDEGTLNENDPADFVFGFGRRICPGRYVADASLFASIATMLATLEFYPPNNIQGDNLAPQVKWVNGITRRPKSFPCRISPRLHVDKSYLECILAELN